MTITRQGTFGAENHSVSRIDLFAGGSTHPTIADTAKTGAHSYQHQGYAFGRSFAATAARSVCALRHGGMSSPGRLPIVTIGVGYAPLTVMWEPLAGQLKLMAGFEEGETDYRYPIAAVPDTPIATANTWRFVGISVKIDAVAGYVSFYVDGTKVLTWTGDTRIYAMEGTDLLTSITGIYWFGNEYNVTLTEDYSPVGVWGANSYIDDLTIDLLDGADAADALPRYRSLLWASVNTNGSTNQWTKTGAETNAVAVADNPADDATSYVSTATDAKTDQYVLQQIPLTGYTPEVVTIVTRGRRASMEGINTKVGLFTQIASTQDLAAAQSLQGDWNEIESTFWAKPGTGAWDAAAIGNLSVGIKSEQ